MKRFSLLVLAAMLAFSVFPSFAFAIESDSKELDAFLKEINWEKQTYLDYLESKDYSWEDFDSVDELGTPLSEAAIPPVLEKYNLTRAELNALLEENGDVEKGQDVLDSEWLLFAEELDEYVGFYLSENTETPLTDEALQQLIEDYGFETKENLESFLNEYDDSIANYDTVEALEEAIDNYIFSTEYGFELAGLFEELGLTEEELERLEAHLNTLPIETPDFQDRAMALADRMMLIGDFDSADDLSAEQIAEILDIFSDLLDLFELKTQYFLVKDSDKKEINLSTLISLETVNGYDLLVEIYNNQGTFLADILLTAEMFGSDIIKETGEDIKEAEETVVVAPAPIAKSPTSAKAAPVKQTVKGGKLPDTASPYVTNTLAGLALVLLGVVLYRRFKAQGI
ncbi:processed acidic surface protein [Planomicrobium chinense]|uniref:processed acidic surface protein n=1 Tax=Planococcus chinensis TaxID=272917 RepID=UPI001CC53E33|nr:processed acidic surface protein [Planococcus chinensis]MBZ5200593.1 processed acidic surface protein [Planococcus chinensis]